MAGEATSLEDAIWQSRHARARMGDPAGPVNSRRLAETGAIRPPPSMPTLTTEIPVPEAHPDCKEEDQRTVDRIRRPQHLPLSTVPVPVAASDHFEGEQVGIGRTRQQQRPQMLNCETAGQQHDLPRTNVFSDFGFHVMHPNIKVGKKSGTAVSRY